MPPGGTRVGKPGATYSNRSDLNTGDRTYGDNVNKATVAASTPNTQVPPEAMVRPGQLTSLDAPSQRPNEPITAGLPMGAGPGPEALSALPARGASDDLFELRALYRMFPNEDLRRLIEAAENRL